MHALFRLTTLNHGIAASFVLETTNETHTGGGCYVWHDLSAPGDVERGGTFGSVGWLHHGTWEYDHSANSIRLYEGPGRVGPHSLGQRELVLVLRNAGHEIFTGPRSGDGYIYRSANTAFQSVQVEWTREESRPGVWPVPYPYAG